MNKLEKEYVNSIAGEEVSEEDAVEFLIGMEEHLTIIFDTEDSEGFLVSRTKNFVSLRKAMEFARTQTRKIIIGEINNNKGETNDNFKENCQNSS